MGWHRCGDQISAFSKLPQGLVKVTPGPGQSYPRAWCNFDQRVEKTLWCAKKLHGRHICCMGEYMVMFSVTYMGFSAFVLLTAMVIRPKLPKLPE